MSDDQTPQEYIAELEELLKLERMDTVQLRAEIKALKATQDRVKRFVMEAWFAGEHAVEVGRLRILLRDSGID